MRLTHKEMTAHLRKRIKQAGIKAKVRMVQSPQGTQAIQVNCPAYDVDFTEEEQRKIRHIAKCNRMTWIRGMEIDVNQMTNPNVFEFYI